MHYKRWQHHPGSFARRPTTTPRRCTVPGCAKAARSTGKIDAASPSALYCGTHYLNYRRCGDPTHSDRQRERYRTVGVKSNGYYRSSDSKGHIGDLVHRTVAGARPNEVVHHIDLDRTNNSAANLLRLGRSEHGLLHGALMRLTAELMRDGTIQFDRGQGRYVLHR